MKPDDYSGLDVSIRELEQEWGISRNALKQRAKRLGVELKPISSTLTVWPAIYVELGHQLHAHLQSGQTMASFPGIAPTEVSVTAPTAAMTPQNEVAVLALAAAIKTAIAETKDTNPLMPAELLKKAAELQVPLTNKEMAAVLGFTSRIRTRHDGMEPRPGYRLRRTVHHAKPFWTVEAA